MALKPFADKLYQQTAGGATSKNRWAITKEDLFEQKWHKCAHNYLPVVTEKDIVLKQGDRSFGRELPVVKDVRPIIVTMVQKTWPSRTPPVDLVQRLLQEFVKAGIPPMFQEDKCLAMEEAKGWHKMESFQETFEKQLRDLRMGK